MSASHHNTRTVIIGGGQAGLALSRCLTDRGLDHVVLERGRIAERWYSERWESLRLLTPNWMTRLPGHAYTADDPTGFMTANEVAAFLSDYAASFRAPIVEHTTVRRARQADGRFIVDTDDGTWTSASVVVATGWCDQAALPADARSLDKSVHQIVPSAYRRPDDLPDGGVLVVGASATGVQLAHELHHSGRPVTVAVGSHARMPRQYRGIDTFWWLDQMRVFDRTIDSVADARAARREPSLQLVGRPDHRTLDLPALVADGVRLVGRLTAVDGQKMSLRADLAALMVDADRKMSEMLGRIDDLIERVGLESEVLDAEPFATLEKITVPDSIDLRRAGITSVVWATGFRRRYDWLELPIFDTDGEIAQRRGVTGLDGAYVLGQRFQHHRNSNFIDGVGRDAAYVADHICARSRRSVARHTNSFERN